MSDNIGGQSKVCPYSYGAGDSDNKLLRRLRQMARDGALDAEGAVFRVPEIRPTIDVRTEELEQYFNELRLEILGTKVTDELDAASHGRPGEHVLSIFVKPLRMRKIEGLVFKGLANFDMELYSANRCPTVSSELWLQNKVPCVGGWITIRGRCEIGSHAEIRRLLGLHARFSLFDGGRWLEEGA